MVVPEEGFKLLCTIFLLSSIPQKKFVGFNYDGTQVKNGFTKIKTDNYKENI